MVSRIRYGVAVASTLIVAFLWTVRSIYPDGEAISYEYQQSGPVAEDTPPHLLTRISDVLTAVAYFSIPAEIAYFTYRANLSNLLSRRLVYIASLFVVFITACGTTHAISAIYADQAHMYPPKPVLISRGITAIVSVTTAAVMALILPSIITMPVRYVQMESSMVELGKRHKSLTKRNEELSRLRLFTESIRTRLLKENIIVTAIELLATQHHFDRVAYIQVHGDSFTLREYPSEERNLPFPDEAIEALQVVMEQVEEKKRIFLRPELLRGSLLNPMSHPIHGIAAIIEHGGYYHDVILLLRHKPVAEWPECDAMAHGTSVDTSVERARLDPVWDALAQLSFALSESDAIERLQDTVDRVRKQNQELEEAQKQAARATRAKGEFLAAMSHEIRTPLQAIIGYADLLEQKTSGEDVAIVKTIKSSGNILVQVINDILSYSKYKSKDFKLQATPFSIRECIEEAMDVSAGLATDESTPYILLTPFNKNSRGVTSLEALLDMVYELEPDVPYRVEADHRLVMQILVNLLFNALKFTDKGFVRVVVGTTEESGLRISVSDTGCGIPPEKIPMLFKKFSQLDHGPTRKYGGTGLGLAICRKLVSLLGGKITAYSSGVPGEGSTFTLEFPVKIIEQNGPPISCPKKKVSICTFVVEDMVIRQMKRFIAHLNAEIKPLRSISALEGCDLLVVDWRRASIAPQAERYQKELLKIGELGTVKRVVLIRNSPRTASSISKDLCDVAVTIPLKKSVFLEALGVEKQEEPKKPTLEIPRELADSVRVLIVEDNATNQTVIKSQLQALGISSSSSLDGTQAIKATLDVEYDIVLMDIHMPVMDGITATKTIRARTGHQPIIVGITASTEATERELALESGMDMLVSKPFKLAELRSILMKYMPNLPPALPSK